MGRTKRKAAAQRAAVKEANVVETTLGDAPVVRKLYAAITAGVPELRDVTAALITKQIWQPDAAGRVEVNEETWSSVRNTLTIAGHSDVASQVAKVMMAFSGLVAAEAAGQQTTSKDEQVLITKKWSSGKRNTGTKSTAKSGAKHQKRKSPVALTLGIALSQKERKPKPRTMINVDNIVWCAAQETALEQLNSELEVKHKWSDYYTHMCDVGKVLLASEIHRRTQLVYDFRASKTFTKQLKRHKQNTE
jgi:hypothetical protein